MPRRLKPGLQTETGLRRVEAGATGRSECRGVDREDDIELLVVAEFQDDLNLGNPLPDAMFDGFDGFLKVHGVQFMTGPAAPGTEVL